MMVMMTDTAEAIFLFFSFLSSVLKRTSSWPGWTTTENRQVLQLERKDKFIELRKKRMKKQMTLKTGTLRAL